MSSRYSDDPNNNNRQSGPNHFHSRSTPRRNKNNNPIGNWIQNRRRNRSSQPNPSQPRPVGTEAKALENMTKNANFFRYPPEGFVTPIEHSLLYAMILYPEQYPESVVRKEIHDEDFEQYLYVRDPPPRQQQSNGDGGGANDDSANHSHNANSHDDPRESRVSYAQLSALLALSAEKHPSATAKDANSPPSDAVGQTLCRRLLKTVTRYAESHSLDRHGEIRELLDPVERRCRIRNEQAALKQLLPAYAGYTLSLVTGNPLPLLIGAAALVGNDPMVEENENVCGFRGMGGRTADLETAGLLDECEDD